MSKTGFFAYANTPVSIGETVENAIREVNKGILIQVESWRSLSISGHFIIDEIIRSIQDSDIFLCELSSLNSNVLFELGFAVAKRKQISIFIDNSLANVKEQFDRFGLLSSIGYNRYTNSSNITSNIYEMISGNANDLLESGLLSIDTSDSPHILYIKSPFESESSIALSRRIDEQKVKTIIDDPREAPTQSIIWYIEKIINSNGIVAHLLSDNMTDTQFHNARASFICGLAYGLGIPVLMLAMNPLVTPLDYKETLRKYDTLAQCDKIAIEWFDKTISTISNRKHFDLHTLDELKAQNELRKLDIGDYVTENELDTIANYYVRTYSFEEALRRTHSIFIGRKGCGKTANLYNLANEFERNRQNHVCVIKPVAYEIEGVLQVLNDSLTRAESGYLIESIWKYLVYTELAKSIYMSIKSMPAHRELGEDEKELIEYVDDNAEIILPEFSVRLDYVVRQLKGLEKSINESIDSHQLKVSELIHENVLKKVRTKIGKYCSKRSKIAILIDNLDKAWNISADAEMLSRFIFGLLDVGNSILRDFTREDFWRQPINLSLIIFLREDIYSQMAKYVPERDKLTIQKIVWEDPEILLRVIEERMGDGNTDIWRKYFCITVHNKPTKIFLTENIIPRPRDLINLVKSSLSYARSRKHTRIEEDDIVSGIEQYSHFALETLISELEPQYNNISSFLFEFAGGNQILNKSDIEKAVLSQNVIPNNIDELIVSLCKLSFLGLEISLDEFTFIYNEDNYNKYSVMARRMAQSKSACNQRYKIHPAFHANLFIETSESICR